MSVHGQLTVVESDDPRYTEGQTYNVRIYADRTCDIDNDQAGPSSAADPVLPPNGEEAFDGATTTTEPTGDAGSDAGPDDGGGA